MQHKFTSLHKIKTTQNFDICIKAGECVRTSFFTCFVRLNKLEQNRFGAIISKKWHKHAVKRNQLRRWLKEGFRQAETKLYYDIVIIPKRNKQIEYKEVKCLWKILKLRLN